MSQFNPENDPLVIMPDKNRPSGCRILLTFLLVFAMLAVSASGAIWFFFFRDQPQETIPVTAVPTKIAATAEVVESEPTSLPATVNPAEVVNQIVYVDETGQVVAIEPDGSNARQLTDTQQRFQFPTWSPDGRFVATIGSDVTGTGLFVLSAAKTRQAIQPLYADRRNAPFYLFWSPDSNQVSFLASNSDGIGLHLVQADGSADSRLLTVGGPLYWAWTADSRQILIHSGFAGEASRLELIEADGNGTGEAIAAPGYFQAPGISADGRYLAYAEEINGISSQLVVVDRQTGAMEQQRHAGQVALAWSPTANQIAFINGTEQNDGSFIGPLRLLDAATGEVRVLSRASIVAFFWSPDGRYLAAFSLVRRNEGDINAWAGKDVAAKRNQQQNLPRLRLLVYDVSNDEGRFLFDFVPTLPFARQFLPYFDQYALSHTLWSPNSDALVLSMEVNDRNQIFTINIATGQKRFLANGLMPFWSPK
jgi:Tol biopolymer transport system component